VRPAHGHRPGPAPGRRPRAGPDRAGRPAAERRDLPPGRAGRGGRGRPGRPGRRSDRACSKERPVSPTHRRRLSRYSRCRWYGPSKVG